MAGQTNDREHGRFPAERAWLVVVPGALVVLLAGLVLLGWYLRVLIFVQIVPGWTPMARSTAVAMVLAGAALVGLGLGRQRLRLLGLAGLAIGALTLAEHALGVDLRIDNALLPDPGFVPGVTTLRMAPNTAVALTLVGLGLLPSSTGPRRPLAVGALAGCGSPVAALGLITIFGYVSSTPTGYGWAHQSMPMPTAVCCLLLGAGMITRSRRASMGSARPSWPVAPLVVGGVSATLLLWWAFAPLLEVKGSRTIAVSAASNAIVLIGSAFSVLLAAAVDLGRRAAQRAEERDHAERQASQRAAELRRIVDSIGDAVLVTDDAGSLVLVNRHAQRILSLAFDDHADPEPSQLPLFLPDKTTPCPPDQLPWVRALRGETFEDLELVVRPPGRADPVEITLTGHPLHSEDGAVRGAVLAFRDVTERNRVQGELRASEERYRLANEQLEQRTAALQASNAELEAFSYSVSHDLRAPLRAMSGFSSILAEEHGATLPAGAREYIGLIRQSASHMGQLIDHLLALSRLQRQPMQPVELDPADIVTRVWDRLAPERQGRQVELRVGELPPCLADPGLLERVLVNLFDNALKFTRTRPLATIEVGACDHEGATAYYVRDSGVGFDMRYADKLFKVFQRLHNSADFEGTGIGLALVQRIISRHGGQIWADCHQGHDTTFYFTLGRATADDGDGHADPAGGGRPQRRAPDYART